MSGAVGIPTVHGGEEVNATVMSSRLPAVDADVLAARPSEDTRLFRAARAFFDTACLGCSRMEATRAGGLRQAERCWRRRRRGGQVTPDQAREFVARNHQAVMVTLRSGGGLQTSPVTVGIDSDGKVVISSRETAYKVRNLRRRPTATLCVFTDTFFGPWIQIDGTTEIVPLPQAMDRLIDYYRRISGEHPDWDDYRRAMVDQQRVLIRLTIDNVGPTHAG
jgi:PPOX class probable F420-dependent enzyme